MKKRQILLLFLVLNTTLSAEYTKMIYINNNY